MSDDNPYRAPEATLTDGPDTVPAEKLAWYDNLWLALPFGLVAVGGAIGGACGGAAWALNKKVFRATKQPTLRYVWTGLISAAAVAVYLLIVVTILVIQRRNG